MTPKSIGAWITGNLLTIAVVGIVGYLAWTKFSAWRDSENAAKRTVAESKVDADKPIIAHDSVSTDAMDKQLAAKDSEIARLLRRPPLVVRIPVGTAHDSVVHLSEAVQACRAESDTLIASVIQFRSACQHFRDSATKSIADLKLAVAHYDTLSRLRSREKRVQSYADLGYEPLKMRPIVDAGVTTKLFWNVHVRAEVGFAIPRTAADSTAGFRFITAAHVRF